MARGGLLLACSLALLGAKCTLPSYPPSFIVILVDALRADYLGCYGFEGPVSPHLDALARESYVFRRCYSSAPWTKPSVASLFTSLNPTTHGVTNHEGAMWGADAPDLQKGVLRTDAFTLGERLKARGYTTAAFVANPWLTWQYGFDQGFDIYNSLVDPPAERVVFEAEKWLASAGAQQPFFLYLHFLDVHAPYDAPDSTYERVRTSPSIRTEEILSEDEWNAIFPSILRSRWALDANGEKKPETRLLETWRGRYAAGVRNFDDQIGPFLRRLDEAGWLDRSYVIVTSDHGEALHDHGQWDHGYSLYEDQLHVPLFIRPPGGLEAPREIDPVVGLIDVLPTVVAWSGEPSENVEGRDLAPLLTGTGPGGSGIVFSGAMRTNPYLFAVTSNPYRLHMDRRASRLALFDLARDPGETRNLVPERPQETQALRTHLLQVLEASQERPLFQAATPEIPPERLELLRSLGYLN